MSSQNSTPQKSSSGVDSGKHWHRDVLASLVVFLVALPLCMGIALASGAPVSAGLVTGIIGGLLVGTLAGSPLQVSGPAAGLTVVCGEIIRQHGMQGLGIAVMLGGIIQLVAGISRLGQWFRAVSPAVIHGMLSGIGILILSGQLHVLVDDRPRDTAVKNITAVPESILKGLGLSGWEESDVRLARIQSIRTANALFDRQRSLQRNIDRTLRRRSESEKSGELPSEFRTTQDTLRSETAALSEMIQRSPLAESGNAGADADAENLLACRNAVDKAAEALSGVDPNAADFSDEVQKTQAAATAAAGRLLAGLKRNDWAGKIGILSVVIIFAWQAVARGRLRLIPAPLLAIVIATVVAQMLAMPILYVDVPDHLLEGLTFPSLESLRELSLKDLVISGFVLAIIASAETLLCATAVDQMQNGPRTRYNKELMAQGIGNTVCGLLGALPMTGVIVRSAANVQAGGRSRLSAVLHGLWLLLFTWALTPLLRMIPTAALAGILVYTGFRLIDFKGFLHLWRTNRAESFIFLITVVMIIVEDLLIGVVTGIVLSALKLLVRFSELSIVETVMETTHPSGRASQDGSYPPTISMELHGAATFLRLPSLATRLEKIPAGAELHVDLARLEYIDHACLELLINWAKQHSSTGGRLVIDWDTLHARFQKA